MEIKSNAVKNTKRHTQQRNRKPTRDEVNEHHLGTEQSSTDEDWTLAQIEKEEERQGGQGGIVNVISLMLERVKNE